MLARTIARTLCTLRAFDAWLTLEGLGPRRLLADLGARQTPRRLPCFLAKEEVERLLQPPAQSAPHAVRDQAMLEVLYATGLRVSELVSLPMSALHLADGWIKVRGKGGQERLAPIGESAVDALRAYLVGPRAALLRGQRGRASPSRSRPIPSAPASPRTCWRAGPTS